MRWASHSRLGIWGKTKCCDGDGHQRAHGSVMLRFDRIYLLARLHTEPIPTHDNTRSIYWEIIEDPISNYSTIQRNGAGPSRVGGRDCQAHILLPIHCNWIDYPLLVGYPHELAHLSKAWGRNGSPFRAANIAEWHPSPPVLSPSPQPVYWHHQHEGSKEDECIRGNKGRQALFPSNTWFVHST